MERVAFQFRGTVICTELVRLLLTVGDPPL
jgi:hypothetical protein